MSEPLTVNTPFTNISELAQGYINRVSPDRMILPAAAPIEEGDWLQFIVVLGDGTPAFAGVGRCIAVADRGQRAAREARYELTLDALGFEDDSRAVFEHMVLVRDAMLGPQEPAPAQSGPSSPQSQQQLASDSSEEQVAVAEEAIDPEPPPVPLPVADSDEAMTEQRTPVPPAPVIKLSASPPVKGSILTRPAIPISWEVPPMPPSDSPPPTGLFQYRRGEIPIPKKPPRPDLDPSLWIKPAPRAAKREEARATSASPKAPSPPPKAEPFPEELNTSELAGAEPAEPTVDLGDDATGKPDAEP